MPTYNTADRYGLRALSPGNQPGSGIDEGFVALRDDVSAKLTPYDAGVLASRPVSTPGTPGIAGREYRATDTGQLFKDYGTGWSELPAVISATVNVTTTGGGNGTSEILTVSVPGAEVGDPVVASAPASHAIAGVMVSAIVTAAGTVAVVLLNRSGLSVVGSGPAPIKVRVFK